MISVEEIYVINKNQIDMFGGMGCGLLKPELAESCVIGVYQEVFGEIFFIVFL